jgi:DNA-binding MarR family transcriptional regulator
MADGPSTAGRIRGEPSGAGRRAAWESLCLRGSVWTVTTPEPEPDTEVLAQDLLAAMGLVRRHVRRVAGRPWPLSSLTASQTELIRLVRRNPGISVAEAAAELGLVPNTVSTLVGQLTEQGLLSRQPDQHDRRVARLTLTAPAQRQVEAWHDRRAALVTQVLERLDRSDLDALRAALPALGAIAEHLRPDQEGQEST